MNPKPNTMTPTTTYKEKWKGWPRLSATAQIGLKKLQGGRTSQLLSPEEREKGPLLQSSSVVCDKKSKIDIRDLLTSSNKHTV